MVRKIMLLLSQDQNQAPGILASPLASEGQRIQKLLPKGAFVRHALRVEDDPTRQMAFSHEMVDARNMFSSFFEVVATDMDWSELTPAIQGIAKRLGDRLDPKRSAVIAGTEHIILPGEGPLRVVYALRRLPSMTSEAFHDYWLNRHAEVARTVPGMQGYRQFHADLKATLSAAKASGLHITDFEGAAEAQYGRLKDLLELISNPERMIHALEDEKNFIDHSRSQTGVYRVAS